MLVFPPPVAVEGLVEEDDGGKPVKKDGIVVLVALVPVRGDSERGESGDMGLEVEEVDIVVIMLVWERRGVGFR